MLDRGLGQVDFGELFQSLPVAAVVVLAHSPGYPIISANDAFHTLATPKSPAGQVNETVGREIIGKDLLTVIPAGLNPEAIRQALDAVTATGQSSTVTQNAGQDIWTLQHKPFADETGTVRYIAQYLQVTPLASADIAQPQSRIDTATQQLLQTFEFAGTGLILFDLNGRIMECNAAFANALGTTREQLKLSEAAAIVHPADREQRNHHMWKLFSGDVPAFAIESRYVRRDGSEAWACDSVSLLRDDAGNPQRILVISEDISTRKRAEKTLAQTERLATMGRLSASIAHELNNPLESVTNLLFLISNGSQIEDMHYYAHLAQQELARVTKIATQTLRFYRPQSAPAPVDLTDVMESVLSLFEGRIRRDHVKVVKRYRPRTPSLVAYSSELRQVFLNLVGNSLDAMAANGLLQVSVRPSRNWVGSHARGVRVTVCDAGSGIPRSLLQKVFEPFVSTKEQSGTGLGLWISRDIIRRHGGTLHVRSSETGPRHGTCMSVFLPAATEQADANAA